MSGWLCGCGIEENQEEQITPMLLGREAVTWWIEYIKDEEIVESEMTWTAFKTLVTSKFYPRVCE